MITNNFLLAVVLVSLVVLILEVQKRKIFPSLFHYLPAPFWCYFLPMLLATAGVLPGQSPVYRFLTTYLLSGCLILLLLSVNLPSILQLGPTALGALAAGSFGIGVGAVTSYALFAHWLPADMWKGVGALSASWTGGSANMLAVKEGLQTPDNVFAPMIIVDTVITYSWMGIMIALAAFQDRWDAWVKADRSTLDDALKRIGSGTHVILRSPTATEGSRLGRSRQDSSPLAQNDSSERPQNDIREGPQNDKFPHWIHAIWLIGVSMLIGKGCLWLGEWLPSAGGIFNPSAWAFLLVTLIGILLSFTPASRFERYGASHWGYLCLYLLLAAMGSKANLRSIIEAPLLLVMGALWVLIHASILALYGYFRRVPMFFLAASTQANLGGTASAPIVAGVYQPRLAPVGLLLAIALNTVGTYIGYLIAHVCRFVHS